MKLLWQSLIIIFIPVIILVGGYYVILWYLHDYDKNFLEADKCLDGGGIYNYSSKKCWRGGECEDQGGNWDYHKRDCIIKEN